MSRAITKARIEKRRMLKNEFNSMKSCTSSKTMTNAESTNNVCCSALIKPLSFRLQFCSQTRLTKLQMRTNKRTKRRGKRALSDMQKTNRKSAIMTLRNIRKAELDVNICVNKAMVMYHDCNAFKWCCSGTFPLNNTNTQVYSQASTPATESGGRRLSTKLSRL